MRAITHPGKRISELTEENYTLRRQLLIANQRLSSLNNRLDMAQSELSIKNYSLSSIPPIQMTKRVLGWIAEFGVPWESLYCPGCKSWFSDLDKLFPYHQEFCVCECEDNGGDSVEEQTTSSSSRS